MAADAAHEEWSANSNNAVHIALVTPSDSGIKTLHSFNPKMTYSIFGDEETVFGYQGLKINLRYNACDMRPGVQILYTKKFKTFGETSATDLRSVLEPYLPNTAFEKSAIFETAIADSSYADWTPPGELWKTIDPGGQTYEVWKGNLADPAVRQMMKRIQVLVPLFIEGGTLIELKDPEWTLERWTVFFLYQKKTANLDPQVSPYTFTGYSTVYRYFLYQPITPPSSPPVEKQRLEAGAKFDFRLPIPEIPFSSLPCRSRISQFVILPPFQGGGNGSRFYNAIFEYYAKEPQTIEITVEDPNVDFDDLRDINDIAYLRRVPEFAALRINTSANLNSQKLLPTGKIIHRDNLEKIRVKSKIAPRQFSRVVEMQLLSLIPTGIRQSLIEERTKLTGADLKVKKHEYHLWQLFVKQRLYKHNKDMLMQLERTERIDKLEETLGAVEADYARLLRAVDKRSGGKLLESHGNEASASGSGTSKRSSPDEAARGNGEPSSKKVKFA